MQFLFVFLFSYSLFQIAKYFPCLFVSLEELLMVVSALEGISGEDKLRHIVKNSILSNIKQNVPSFLFRSHFEFIQIEKDGVEDVLIISPGAHISVLFILIKDVLFKG